MKRLLFLFTLFLPALAQAQDGVSTVLNADGSFSFDLRTHGASDDFIDGISFSTGDCASSACCQVSIDGGDPTDCDNQPTAVTNSGYRLIPSAAELSGCDVKYRIVDAGSPKRWSDKSILFRTYGGGAACHGTPQVELTSDSLDDVNAEVDTALSDYGALKPTVSGRTLDVTTTGEAGLDFSNFTGTLGSAAFANDFLTAAKVASDVGSEIGGAVWDITRSSHTTSGTFGQGIASIQGNVTGSVGSVTGSVGSVTGNVGGNVVGTIGGLGSLAKSDVNAEVVDALATDTYGELSSCPTATASFSTMIRYLYMVARNKLTQTSTTQTLYKSDGSSPLCTFTVGDDGTTFTKGAGS